MRMAGTTALQDLLAEVAGVGERRMIPLRGSVFQVTNRRLEPVFVTWVGPARET